MRLAKTLALGTAGSIALLCAGSAFALDNAGTVTGVVNGANGKPVAGAFVRLKNADIGVSSFKRRRNVAADGFRRAPHGISIEVAVAGRSSGLAMSQELSDDRETKRHANAN